MRKTFNKSSIYSLALVLFFFLPVSCSGQNKNTMQENITKDGTSVSVPAEKKQQWESLKNNALKNFDVCQEHCGYEQSCLDKCEVAYNSRLERDYNVLLDEK